MNITLSEKDRSAIEEFRERTAQLLGDHLQKIALFGSKIEGRDLPESDIDILVLIEDSAIGMRTQILDQAFEVNLKYGVYISPRIITIGVYNHPVWSITPFLKRIRERGVPL